MYMHCQREIDLLINYDVRHQLLVSINNYVIQNIIIMHLFGKYQRNYHSEVTSTHPNI